MQVKPGHAHGEFPGDYIITQHVFLPFVAVVDGSENLASTTLRIKELTGWRLVNQCFHFEPLRLWGNLGAGRLLEHTGIWALRDRPQPGFCSYNCGARPEPMGFGLLSGSYVLRRGPESGGLSLHSMLGLRNHRLGPASTDALSKYFPPHIPIR